MSKELNAIEAKQERSQLKIRNEFVQWGSQRNELRIRDLKLLTKKGIEWVEIKEADAGAWE